MHCLHKGLTIFHHCSFKSLKAVHIQRDQRDQTFTSDSTGTGTLVLPRLIQQKKRFVSEGKHAAMGQKEKDPRDHRVASVFLFTTRMS